MLNPKEIVGQDKRYEVQRLLAQGGMSNVYICRRVLPGGAEGVNLVLKEMTVSYRDPEDQRKAVELFEREASILEKLRHKNLPVVFDRFKEGNRHYFVMEFVEGEDLGKLIVRNPDGLPEARVVDWAIQVATVLYYLHIQKPAIIFRDLKPSNIMVSRGVVKLIDFGIARKFDHFKKKDTMRIGSPGYAPPEQYSGQTDARSDIYSFGVTLHQLLTGRDPSETQTPFRLPPVRDLKPSISPEMEAIVARATDMEPRQRYENALEMKRALQALAGVGTGSLTAGLPGAMPGTLAAVQPATPFQAPPNTGGNPPPRFQAPPTNLASQSGTGASPHPVSPAPPAASAARPAPVTSVAGPPATSQPPPESQKVARGQGTVPNPPQPAGSAGVGVAGAAAVPATRNAGDATQGSRPGTAAGVRLLQQSSTGQRRPGGGILSRVGRMLRTMVILGLPIVVLAGAAVWSGGLAGPMRTWPVIGPWFGGASPSPSASPSPDSAPRLVAPWHRALDLLASGHPGQAMDMLEDRWTHESPDGMGQVIWNNALVALSKAEPVRFQVLVPLGATGEDWVQGLALAQRHLNRAGGIAGHPVVLELLEVPLEAGGTSATGNWLEAARSSNVVGTLAVLPADLVQEAAGAYSAAGIPLIATGCTVDRSAPGVQGFAPSSREVMDRVRTAMRSSVPGKRVVMVQVGAPVPDVAASPSPGAGVPPLPASPDGPASPDSSPVAVSSPSVGPASPSRPSTVSSSPEASRTPAPALAVLESPRGLVDLAPIISRNPDLVVVVGDPVRVAKWVTQAREMGLKKPVLSTFALLQDATGIRSGLEAGGLWVVTPYSPAAGDLPAERFALSFAGVYSGAKPGYWAAAGYETLAGLAGVLSSGDTDPFPQGWRKALAAPDLNLPSPMGTLDSVMKGGVPRRWFLLRLQGGAWTTVKASF